MENHIQAAREIIATILAFSVIHYFYRYFYHLSLWDVVKWWTLNFYKVENIGAYAVGLFFGLLIYILTFSGFANTMYLGLFGEKQELVYLGHSKESTGVYYRLYDTSKILLSAYDVDIKYNFSFDTLLRPQLFKKDPGTTNTVGTKADRFSPLSFIGITCAMASILLAATGIFHPFAFKVYMANPTDIALPITNDPMIAFDHVIAQFHLTRGVFFLLVFGLFFCFLGFTWAAPGQKLGVRVESFPNSIRPGSVIHGIPNEIKPRLVRRKKSLSSNSSDYEWVDSGDRYVNFTFSEGFTRPVYVASLLTASDQHEVLSKVEDSLRSNTPMTVKIGEDLSIKIYLAKQ